MKTKKLFLALPLLALLSGCNAQETAEKTYYTSKDYFMGRIVDPLLDKIDGGEQSIIETKTEKAVRLFKTTFSANNAHFNVVKKTKENEEYTSYVFADGKYQVTSFSSSEDLISNSEEGVISSTIYTEPTIYHYAGGAWTEQSSSESTLVDFSCYNSIAKTMMESDPINIVDSFGIKSNSGVYSSSGALNMTYDTSVFEMYSCTMFITFRLNKSKTFVSTANIMVRKNTKLIGSEEAVGETIEYQIDIKSISDNKIGLPEQKPEPEEENEEIENIVEE